MGVTERPGSLHPSKTVAIAICPIIIHFSTWRARSMHDVAFEFARAAVRSKDAQKQLARTSLTDANARGILAKDKSKILYSFVSKTRYLIGLFRVPLCLCFKASLNAKPFLWNWLWFAWKWNCMQNSFHMKGLVLRFVLKQRHKRTRKWPIAFSVLKIIHHLPPSVVMSQ